MLDEADALGRDTRILDKPVTGAKERPGRIHRSPQRRTPAGIAGQRVAQGPVVNVVACERSRGREVQQPVRGEDQGMTVTVRLHIDEPRSETGSNLIPAHELPGVAHPVRGHEQRRAGLEVAQDRQRRLKEITARVVEGQQHAAPGVAALAVAEGEKLREAERPVLVAVQKLEVAGEPYRIDVVVDEDRDRAAPHRQAKHESRVMGTHRARDAAHDSARACQGGLCARVVICGC